MASDMLTMRQFPSPLGPYPIITPTSPLGRMPTSQPTDPLQGTLIPNKVFIGGLAEKTTVGDIREAFSNLADVKEVKIITDRSLISKSGEPRRYAFVELQNEKDEENGPAKDVQRVVEFFSKKELELHGRRLNVGHAYKKVPTFGRIFGPGVPAAPVYDNMNTFDALYMQQLLLHQQRLMSQAAAVQYPMYNAYMQPQSPTSMMNPTSLSSGMYPGLTAPSSPLGFAPQQVAMPSSPSHDLRSQQAAHYLQNSRLMNTSGSQDSRNTTLIRTLDGFVEADPANMIQRQQVYYQRHQ